MSVKFVVFIQFALRIVFNILVGYNLLEKSEYWTAAQESILLQSFSTVFQMMIAAIWHLFAFRLEFFPVNSSAQEVDFAILDVVSNFDIVNEIHLVWNFITKESALYFAPTAVPADDPYTEDIERLVTVPIQS